MKVNLTLLVLSLWLFSCSGNVCASGTQSDNSDVPFVTYNDVYFSGDELDSSYIGSLGAISGEIIERKNGPENRLLLKLKLSGVDQHLWVATTVEVLKSQFSPGDNIDVLGFFDETAKEPEYVGKATRDMYYLIGFCFRINPLGQPIFNSYLLKRCLDWESGRLELKIPHKNIQR